jgi:hypothetical protein
MTRLIFVLMLIFAPFVAGCGAGAKLGEVDQLERSAKTVAQYLSSGVPPGSEPKLPRGGKSYTSPVNAPVA